MDGSTFCNSSYHHYIKVGNLWRECVFYVYVTTSYHILQDIPGQVASNDCGVFMLMVSYECTGFFSVGYVVLPILRHNLSQ